MKSAAFGKLLFCLVLLCLAAGCAPGNVFVLLPDPDGKVGQITVANQGGSQTLTKSGQASGVKDKATKPDAPEVMRGDAIKKEFGDALAAQPKQPVRFLLYFKHDSTELTDESKKLLPKIITVTKERHSVDTSVVGHTDTMGDAKYNVILSGRRAKAVAKLLVKAGIDPDILEITSHGESNLLIPTADEVMEPRNRRVEVTVR